MSWSTERNIGALVKTVAAIRPTNASADVNGVSVERTDYNSAVLHVAVGAASGSPTAQSVKAKIQESDDGNTWTDVSDLVSADLTADNTEDELDFNLEARKKYIRAVAVVSLTGGTSPAIPVAVTLVLGGARTRPA